MSDVQVLIIATNITFFLSGPTATYYVANICHDAIKPCLKRYRTFTCLRLSMASWIFRHPPVKRHFLFWRLINLSEFDHPSEIFTIPLKIYRCRTFNSSWDMTKTLKNTPNILRCDVIYLMVRGLNILCCLKEFKFKNATKLSNFFSNKTIWSIINSFGVNWTRRKKEN